MEEILVCENLTMTFDDGEYIVHALKNVSFSLRKNEVLGIIGESGSGKSTIAKLITGLYQPTGGNIFLGGRSIVRLKRQAQKEVYTKVQMVFQDAVGSFNPRRKIGESISDTLCRLCGEKKHTTEKSTALRSAAPSGRTRSWSTARHSRRTSSSSCARALRPIRFCPASPRKRATSSWMKAMPRAFPAFSRPGTAPACPIRSRRRSARATARRSRSCAGSETLDKRRGRAYNFPIHLRRRGGVVSRRTSERRRLVRAFRMPEMKVAPEQPA